jgi:putative tryptophan/tyrosine transport system substrate-binding protein
VPTSSRLAARTPLTLVNRRQALLACLSPLACRLLAADSIDIRVLLGDGSESSRLIRAAFEKRFPRAAFSFNERDLALTRRYNALCVAVGPEALRRALDAGVSAPLLSLFSSAEAYSTVVAASAGATKVPRLAAIYAEPSPDQQFQLVRNLYGRRVSVGVLLSAATSGQLAGLESAARRWDLDLQVRIEPGGADILRALASLEEVQAVLMIPDGTLYSSDAFRALIESTYRRGKGVIAFTPGLVSAGALAGAYTSIDDTIAQVAEALEGGVDRLWVGGTYPKYWRVQINDVVARSLNLVVSAPVRMLGLRPA